MTGKHNFEFDFAVALHSHSERLVTISQWLEPVLEYFDNDPFADKEDLTPFDVEDVLMVPIDQLTRSIQKLYEDIGDTWVERKIPTHFKTELETAQEDFLEYLSAPTGKKYRPPYLNEKAKEIIKSCSLYVKGNAPKERVKNIITNAREVRRIISLYDLHTALAIIREMEYQTQELRDFYSALTDEPEPMQVISLSKLIRIAIREQGEYANSRGIELKYIDQARGANVYVVKRRILRALTNVINNAIKYNDTLNEYDIWIKIETSRKNGTLCINVENWGVPITQEEIEEGLIFKVGRRGTFASLSGKSGNGIGLSDAKRTVEQHDGVITITSVSAQTGKTSSYYKQKFLTNVIIELPEYHKEYRHGE